MAQKRLLTLEDLNFGGTRYREMSPKNLRLWWKGHKLIDEDVEKRPVVYPIATSKDHNIFVQTSEDAQKIQVTHDGTADIVYGEAVHRNEFGIEKGIFMSPNKKSFAFYRMDQSMVTPYPQVNTSERVAQHNPDRYPMAGMTSHKVTVGIYTIATGKTVWLDLGDVTDRYFTNICWSPDGAKLYLIELNREQTDMKLKSYDATNGKEMQVLYKEHDDKYVEPLHSISFIPWDASKFIMWSQRDGFMHLYIMDTKGQEIGQLTNGVFVVQEILGFCKDTHEVIIRSNECSPLQSNIFAVNTDTGKRTLLDNGKGWHSGKLSDDGTMLLDKYVAPDVPGEYFLTEIPKRSTSTYHVADNPWTGYDIPTYKTGAIKAADGKTDLYYRLTLPHDYDPTLKYPTIVYVYGGPHVHLVDATWHWGARAWDTYMAGKGYIVFSLDGRGSENRGKDFEQSTHLQLGQVEMLDQIEGVKYLKTLPYVDQDRIGVHGWSFGGFMTISLMTNYPNVFKAGVAGGPVIDWSYYEVMYGERYMRTPETNAEGYERTSLLRKAGELKNRLLIITGMNDPVVVPQHSLLFLLECNKAGTYPDFYVFPGEEHNVKGHQSVHLHERISKYFDDFLK